MKDTWFTNRFPYWDPIPSANPSDVCNKLATSKNKAAMFNLFIFTATCQQASKFFFFIFTTFFDLVSGYKFEIRIRLYRNYFFVTRKKGVINDEELIKANNKYK